MAAGRGTDAMRGARSTGLGGAAASMAVRLYDLRWQILPPVTGIAMFAMLVGAVLAAPREAVQGEVQRLFYIHVPSALVMYGAVGVVSIASIMVLWKRDMRWDPVARAAATLVVLFTSLVLLTGMFWGKPTWGVYWAWDARLTSTLVLLLIYVGYLLARAVADEGDEQAARYAAVFALLGALDIPIINMSVRWWRTLHPQPTVTTLSPQVPVEMLIVMLIGLVGLMALGLWLLVLRTETETMSARLTGLRARLDRGGDG